MAQIRKYNWLDINMVFSCHNNMKMINSDTIFEIPISNNSETDYIEITHDIFGLIQIKGRIDAICSDCVWEFKCVDYLSIEHKLQLIIYYWIWNKSILPEKYGSKMFCLLNIKSGQILKLDTNKKFIIDQIVEILLHDKYSEKKNSQTFPSHTMIFFNWRKVSKFDIY